MVLVEWQLLSFFSFIIQSIAVSIEDNNIVLFSLFEMGVCVCIKKVIIISVLVDKIANQLERLVARIWLLHALTNCLHPLSDSLFV